MTWRELRMLLVWTICQKLGGLPTRPPGWRKSTKCILTCWPNIRMPKPKFGPPTDFNDLKWRSQNFFFVFPFLQNLASFFVCTCVKSQVLVLDSESVRKINIVTS